MAKRQSNSELQDAGQDTLRDYSKLLFGNRDRLEVCVAVARSEDGSINATDLMEVLPGWPNNRIRAQLVALSSVGLLSEFPRSGAGRIWYTRQPADFWDACIELMDRWGSHER